MNQDWSFGIFENGAASDGFHVFIDTMPAFFAVPIHIPSSMDASIALSQPTFMKQKSNCWSLDKLPKLRYFDYYDCEGVHCLINALLEKQMKYLGCTMSWISYSSVNESCKFVQYFLYALAASDDIQISVSGENEMEMQENMKVRMSSAKYNSTFTMTILILG